MPFCKNCGTQYAEGTKFCNNCGAALEASVTPAVAVSQPSHSRGKPTRAWYLVPIFLSILGGIIGYFAVRNEDKQLANRLLIIGVIIFVLGIIAVSLIQLMILSMISSI